VRDPAIASSSLAQALPQWLLQSVRGTGVGPADLGDLAAWADRIVECPILPDVFARLLRGASWETTEAVLDIAAAALSQPSTRAPFHAALTSSLDSNDALEPAGQARLGELLRSSSRASR